MDGGGETKTKDVGQLGRVTIRTVAAHSGVSVAAVSKVLRNAYGVSDNLRNKVTASIDALGYRPSRSARGLRGRTFTIGVLLIDIANPFLPQVIAGVNGVLAPSNIRAMIGVGQAETQLETSLIESMIDYKMDGVILVAPRLPSDVIATFARDIPIVVVGYHDPGAQNFDTVNCDDEAGAALAVQALLAQGLSDIGMLTVEQKVCYDVSVVQQRERGYRDAMAAAGLAKQARLHRLPENFATHDAALSAFLDDPERPAAVFCWSDLDAIPLLNLAAARGIGVPDQLAIIGYDNSPLGALNLISLSSVDQDGQGLGALATETLLSRIEGRKAALHLKIPPSLVLRRSAG
ncbi:LacI family transcriptional regulator [Xaviernesmea oryzae]|uniref:LacI family transcriptional regulator n=1 Tax=Xaviernesmea oryzae TaxID=464029 RepID=A0A1Q9AR92_9HYPH|nr:LacI family DNA-binding transcriptional regulator [Xaviernesmea oryzae]OLP57908.1 LacI family transcriptional regulator [Xaviernesmea oryzae]SEL31319.1 transcriptional regulator, LacI family [Xaviernesmea oryzae]